MVACSQVTDGVFCGPLGKCVAAVEGLCECLRLRAPEQSVEIRAFSQNINWLCLECPFILKTK